MIHYKLAHVICDMPECGTMKTITDPVINEETDQALIDEARYSYWIRLKNGRMICPDCHSPDDTSSDLNLMDVFKVLGLKPFVDYTYVEFIKGYPPEKVEAFDTEAEDLDNDQWSDY